jgi:hypothetical protein
MKPGGTDINNASDGAHDLEHELAIASVMDLPGGVGLDARLRRVDTALSGLTLVMRFHLADQRELSVVGREPLNHQPPEYCSPGPERVGTRRRFLAKVAWRS